MTTRSLHGDDRPVPVDYPRRVRELRGRLGLTQAALASHLGVSYATINRWENGQAKPLPVAWARLLDLAAGVHRASSVESPVALPDATPKLDFAGRPAAVHARVEGERLAFGHLSNPAFAAETAQIDPLPHQRLAVYEHMLRQRPLRFLLADDAGAGKTIMAGLCVRELMARRTIRRVLIVPPAGLVGNWERELRTLFNLRFRILEGRDAAARNPFVGSESDCVIVSIDTLAGRRMFSRLAEPSVEPYDLVVFDEAHKLSADRGTDLRVRKTDRYRLAEALAGVPDRDAGWDLPWSAPNILLLTATPHMGKDYPYYALWRLIDPHALSTPEALKEYPPDRRRRHFLRRTKEEMVYLDGRPLYPTRVSNTLAYDLSQGPESEQALYDATTEYLRFVYNKAKLLNRSAARLAMSVFQRRLASSTYAVLRSLERRLEELDRLIDDIQSGRVTWEQLLAHQRRLADEDDVFESKAADEESIVEGCEENERAEERLLHGVIATSLADLVAEREQVKCLLDLARRVHEKGAESKFERLREILTEPKFAEEKIIVFTEHRDTLEFLVRRLCGLGFTGQVAEIHGGMHYKEREEQVDRFRRPHDEGGARFLVCTDAAGEGINLQFCWIMINYDIPWNPARLEQRMGRIHRYGQKHDPVVILNLVAPKTREGRVLKTLLEKLERIRQELKSDKVFDVIGRVLQGVSIKQYMELVAAGEDPDSVAHQLGGLLTKEQIEALAERERRLYGDGGEVKQKLAQVREELDKEACRRLIPGYVRHYLETAAPLCDLKVEGDLGGFFTLRAGRRGAADALLQVLETYPEQLHARLTVVRPESKQDGIWIHPGEPLFEAFRRVVAERVGAEALRGAVFVDPDADRPYLLHVALVRVLREADPDYAELARPETLEYRLVAVRQYEGSEIEPCPVERLLLLKGSAGGLPPAGQRLAAAGENLKEPAAAFLRERVARSLALEHRNRLLASLHERRVFVERGFDFQEAELAAVRAKLVQRLRNGNQAAENELIRVKERQRNLIQRRQYALAVMSREPELVVPGSVEFIAHALVIPSSDPQDRRRHDANAEEVAMQLARAWEESEGAVVQDVHTPELAREAGLPDHPGFDLLSIRPDGEKRAIEVKGRTGTGEIEISANEWARALNMGKRYWLYVVFDCATPLPRLVRIQDPFNQLLAKAKGSVLIPPRQILAAAAEG